MHDRGLFTLGRLRIICIRCGGYVKSFIDRSPYGFRRVVGRFGSTDFGEGGAGVEVEGRRGGKNQSITQGVALSGEGERLPADAKRASGSGVAGVAGGEEGEGLDCRQHVVDAAYPRHPACYARSVTAGAAMSAAVVLDRAAARERLAECRAILGGVYDPMTPKWARAAVRERRFLLTIAGGYPASLKNRYAEVPSWGGLPSEVRVAIKIGLSRLRSWADEVLS